MFKKLADTLSAKYKRKDYLSRQLAIVQVFDIYEKATGTRPTSLKNKRLLVKTRSSAEANQLRLREVGVVRTINKKIGRAIIDRIIYRF